MIIGCVDNIEGIVTTDDRILDLVKGAVPVKLPRRTLKGTVGQTFLLHKLLPLLNVPGSRILVLCEILQALLKPYLLLLLDIREHRQHRIDTGFFSDAAVHIVLGALHDQRGKGEHTDQVGDHHESVKGIGNIPCELRFHEASEKTYKRKDHAIGEDRLCPEQILKRLGAVMAPAKNSRIREQEDRDGDEHRSAFAKSLLERKADERTGTDFFRYGCKLSGRKIHTPRREDRQSCQRADNDGVREYLKDAPHSLFHGLDDVGA